MGALEVQAPIELVLVGRGYAEVTRACDIARVDGALPRAITVGGLGLAVDDASVRVRVEGDAAVVRAARVGVRAAGGDAEPPPDDRAVREAERACNKHAVRCAWIQRELDLLRAVPPPQRPRARKRTAPVASPIDGRIELAALLRERATAVGQRLIDEERAHTLASQRLAALRDARAKASTDRPARRDELEKVIVVDLEARSSAEPARARLVVTYIVPGARWMPAYTLRLDGAEAELEVRALVQQRTGEDWSQVKLSLSSASRLRRADLPELTSLRIGRAQRPIARRGFRAPPEGAGALYADYDRARALFAPDRDRGLEAEAMTITVQASDALAAQVEDTRAPSAPRAPSYPAIRAGLAGKLSLAAPQPAAAPPPPSFGPPGGGGAPARDEGAASIGAPPPASLAAMPRRARAKAEMASLVESDEVELLDDDGAVTRGGFDRLEKSKPLARGHASIDLGAQAFAVSYGSLRMSGAEAERRGELVPIDETDALIDPGRARVRDSMQAGAIVDVSVRVQVVAAALAAARAEAAAFDAAPPPPRHRVPDAFEGFDYAFECEAPVDVPSDGASHAIAVTRARAPVELVHVAVPRESRDAFRCARIVSPLDAPLLAGPVDVYEGPDFLLSGDLGTTAPRGHITIGLGVDPAVKVSRNARFTETTTGLIRGTLELRHAVVVDVANQGAAPIRLEVRERVPTLRDKEPDIEVAVTRVAPSWEPYEPDHGHLRGGHAWRVEVAPAATTKLELDYVVRIASKNELVGGNRRES